MIASSAATAHVLPHPDARIRVEERSGGRRLVTVEPVVPSLFVPIRSAETAYPVDLIEAVLAVKGPAYLCDEILRDESPTYVQAFLERDLLAYLPPEWFRGKRVLDFGCGSGASTICLARLFPDASLVGLELDARLLDLARRRVHYHGFPNVELRRSPSATELPPDLGCFDAVVLSAVYEHLLPSERQRLLPLLWHVVKPGGYLFLNQTPHRYFPLESHTTGLPGINYLPDRLAHAAARRWSPRIRRDETWENLLRAGIRGATEQEILAILSRGDAVSPQLLEPSREGIRDRIDLWYRALNPHRYRRTKQAIRVILKLIRMMTGLTLVPTLSLMIWKPERVEASPAGALPSPARVCFLSPLGYGLYNESSGYRFGGAEVQFYLLANELARDPGYQVTVLVTVRGRPGIERCGPVTVVKRQGKGRLAGGGLLSAASAFRDMLRQLRDISADLYLHAGAGAEVGAYALICRLLRRRFVYVVASSADLSEEDGAPRGPWWGLFSLGVRLAHAVVCRTDEQLRRLKLQYGREGVLIRTGHPVPPAPAFALNGKSTILWVGRTHPLKQPELFLDLAERLPKEQFVMVVMDDGTQKEWWRSVQTRAAALPNVSVHEDVPWRAIGRFFEEAKLFVNTSRYEGFPNTFVQAALHATPILSWAVDPDGVLTRHRIGYCAGRSFERLAEEAERLCASDPQRAAMGRRAREYARQYHDLERSVRELKALVRTLKPCGS